MLTIPSMRQFPLSNFQILRILHLHGWYQGLPPLAAQCQQPQQHHQMCHMLKHPFRQHFSARLHSDLDDEISLHRALEKVFLLWIAARRFCCAAASHLFCLPDVKTLDWRPPSWLVWTIVRFETPACRVTAERFIQSGRAKLMKRSIQTDILTFCDRA